MGDPRKIRKKYYGPLHPWQKSRIEEEIQLLRTYGLKNKREIWKMNSILKGFTYQAKHLIADVSPQGAVEQNMLLKKLNKLGLLQPQSKIENVLNITLKDIMDRRLQTLVFKKNLARSIGQARQFVTHECIMISNKVITAPSYLVQLDEEQSITFLPGSSLANPDHPERKPMEKREPVKEKKESEEKPRRKGRREGSKKAKTQKEASEHKKKGQ